jgi:hypothetical protein
MFSIESLKESWTFLFKEKKWGIKLAIPFIVNIIFGFIVTAVAVVMFIGSVGAMGGSNRDAGLGLGLVVVVIIGILVLIYVVVYSLIAYWYDYEYTQAAMHNRESGLIYEDGFMNVVKKSGKVVVVYFIYNLPVIVMYLVIYGALALFAVGASTSSRSEAGMMALPMLVMVCVLILVTLLIVLPYTFFVSQPAKLRMIYKGKFSEAFAIGEVFSTVKANFKDFMMFALVILGYFAVYMVLNFIITIIQAIPIVGLIMIPVNLVLTVVYFYFLLFVYPHMSGKFYREIMKKN